MDWLKVLNTGANLYQAGAVSNLASTQNQMLSFQINESVSNKLREIEIVEIRRMVVKLTGILEDAMDYIPSHASYAGIVIPMCAEFINILNISEEDFDEASDMSLARSLKRLIRKSRTELNSVWNETIARESEQIGNSLTQGSNVEQFSESWIPDGGELLGEIYGLIARFQEERRVASAPFAVYHIEKKGRMNFFRIDDGDSSFEVKFGNHRPIFPKIRMMDGDGNVISSDHKIKPGMTTGTHTGNIVLPDGSTFQYEIVMTGFFKIKSATFTNDRMMNHVIDLHSSPPVNE